MRISKIIGIVLIIFSNCSIAYSEQLIDAQMLFDSYIDNRQTADSKHGGKRLRIVGLAEKPFGPIGDRILISFKIKNRQIGQSVSSNMVYEKNGFTGTIQEGQKLELSCIIKGANDFGMVNLTDCHP